MPKDRKKRSDVPCDSAEQIKKLNSLISLSENMIRKESRIPIPFAQFVCQASDNPEHYFRDVFQFFYDMLHHYVSEGVDDYVSSEESIGFLTYDSSKLFVTKCESPYFADRLFTNRLMHLSEAFRQGTQRNNIFLFDGPPGSGKSTFLNNLVQKLEEYARKIEGATYKVYWKLDVREISKSMRFRGKRNLFEEEIGELGLLDEATYSPESVIDKEGRYVEFSCPSHDHPILVIPKRYRRKFLDQMIPDSDFKYKLFNEKQYEWVLKDTPCNICTSLYNALMDELADPKRLFSMIYVRKNLFSRQLGEGVSVFNPGDVGVKDILVNKTLQEQLNQLFKHEDIRFMYSYLAKTNNGVLALMDLKENNVNRLQSYHGIISDGVHKIELAEEHISTLFLGLVNPSDQLHYKDIPSFQDRIIQVKIPYILDFETEIAIYRNKFGKDIDKKFLPRVLNNFAKIILSTRMDSSSKAINDWIGKTTEYKKFVDSDFMLLRMALYTGKVPEWLSEEHIRKFTKSIRRQVIDETINQGYKGISGRRSLIVFNRLMSKYADNGSPITMDTLNEFFKEDADCQNVGIPVGFINSLIEMYDYYALQEVKEAIWFYNKEQVSNRIIDYLFAINFETGSTKTNDITGNEIEITDDYFSEFEIVLHGEKSSLRERETYRKEAQKEYISKTVSQEMRLKDLELTETEQYKKLYRRYTRNLKESALAPYESNDSFRRAIGDFGTDSFSAYDDKLKRDVMQLITNLIENFDYNENGAKQIIIYVLDKKLSSKY